ncbi:hypothetical protein [Desulfosporosinus acididurans]|nr:hypothetical protein [Desulfosporosinus acididurans]
MKKYSLVDENAQSLFYSQMFVVNFIKVPAARKSLIVLLTVFIDHAMKHD